MNIGGLQISIGCRRRGGVTAAPEGLALTVTDDSASLTFTGTGDVQRSTDGIGYSVIASAQTDSYSDTGLTGGTLYYYKITNAGGSSNIVTSYANNIGVIAFEGDSRMASQAWVASAVTGVTYGESSTRVTYNAATSGARIQDVIARAAETNLHMAAGKSNVLVIWAGVNQDAYSGVQKYNLLKQYCIDAKTAGWSKVVLCTEVDCQVTGAYGTQWHNTLWPDLNTAILADYSFADALANLGSSPYLTDATDTGYFNVDKIHLAENGYNIVGGLIGDAIERALGYTYKKLTVTASGNGTGIAILGLRVSNTTTLTLDGAARFYSDASGTLNESTTWSPTSGAERTMYLKCSSGTSNIWISANTITEISNWTSGTNAPNIAGDISLLTSLTKIYAPGNCLFTGNIGLLTAITYIVVYGNHTLRGSITTLSNSITFLAITSTTMKITGSIAGKTSLTWIQLVGPCTVNGDLGGVGVAAIVNGLTYCVINPCAMTTYTSGATWTNQTVTINPSVGFGYDASTIDSILIDMAASPALISKTITLKGANAARTAASNAAVATLTGVGRTCTLVLN